MASIASPRTKRPSSLAVIATDGELLMRFRRHRDEAAFAEVVERHGRLVWVVCKQALGHHQDVEDAFQATFLILAQRASTIRASESAAAWLYRVAQRTAIAARKRRAKLREEELAVEPPQGEEALPVIQDRQMLRVLMEELQALPLRYQTPLVMQYFEGQSRRAIAEQTDSTLAQIQGRLVRGKRMLRSRLMRRGVSLSLATGIVATASASASAAVSPSLVAATAASSSSFLASGATGSASPAAAELSKQGLNAMWYASLTKTVGTAAGVLIVAGVLFAAQSGDDGLADVTVGQAVNGVDLQATVAAVAEDEEPAAIAVAAAEPVGQTAGADADAEARPAESQKADYVIFRPDPDPVQQLELERDHWLLKAQAYRMKAELKQKFAEQNQPMGVVSSAERKEAQADALLLEAEAKMAEAKALELEARLKGMQEKEPQAADSQAGLLRRVYLLKPHDAIIIRAKGVSADEPINDTYFIDPSGIVDLGPTYGRVKVAGLTVLETENAIKEHLTSRVATEALFVQAALVAGSDARGQGELAEAKAIELAREAAARKNASSDSEVQRNERQETLDKKVDQLRGRLSEASEVYKSVVEELELLKLDKAAQDREIEALQAAAVQLQISREIGRAKGSDDSVDPKVIEAALDRLRRLIATKMEDHTETSQRLAKITGIVKVLEGDRAAMARQLEYLERANLQLLFPQQMPAGDSLEVRRLQTMIRHLEHKLAATATAPPADLQTQPAGRVTGTLVEKEVTQEQWREAIAKQFDHIHRTMMALQSENAELKKQVEGLRKAQPTGVK